MREYTRTVRIHSTAAESLPACFMLFLKEWAKKVPGLSQGFMETSQSSGIQNGLMIFSSVTWAALTFRNFVQVLLGVNLRSLNDSKYSLKKLSPASYYYPQNDGWGHMKAFQLYLLEQRSSLVKCRLLLFFPPLHKYFVILLNVDIFRYMHIGTLDGVGKSC